MTEENRHVARSGAPRGILFIISAPSGAGKGTLINLLRERVTDLSYSVSWTTREPRLDERADMNYHFVTRDEFERMRAADGFLEWAQVHGNLYGTSREAVGRELAAGRDILLEIDVQGAESVRRSVVESVAIFILPPSFEVLRQRLENRRTERATSVSVRLRNARAEVERYRDFDYVVLNDEAERAAAQLAAIVYAERARRERQESLAQSVLETFREARMGE